MFPLALKPRKAALLHADRWSPLKLSDAHTKRNGQIAGSRLLLWLHYSENYIF